MNIPKSSDGAQGRRTRYVGSWSWFRRAVSGSNISIGQTLAPRKPPEQLPPAIGSGSKKRHHLPALELLNPVRKAPP